MVSPRILLTPADRPEDPNVKDIKMKIAIEEHGNGAGIRGALDRLPAGRATEASPSTP